MTAPRLLTVNLPFPGFFESAYSGAVDHEESQWLEYHAEDNGETGHDYESSWPAPLSLANELGNIMWPHTNHRTAYRKIAESYVAAFDHLAGEAFGMTVPDTRSKWTWTEDGQSVVTPEPYARPSIGMTFESMDSPREYNFTTDRVYGLVPLKTMREIFRRSKAENHETLAAVVRDTFTSYDGFASFYSPDLDSWLAKAGRLQDWDHNELGTLLIAGLQMAGETFGEGSVYDYESPESRLYESAVGDEGAMYAWESSVDWPAFEAARIEARGEKLADWMTEYPDAAKAWIYDNGERAAALAASVAAVDLDLGTVAVRCPDTPDMFAGLLS